MASRQFSGQRRGTRAHAHARARHVVTMRVHEGARAPFSKHISGDRRLGWRDAQTPREDATPIGEARAVPQKLPVADRGLEGRRLTLTIDL